MVSLQKKAHADFHTADCLSGQYLYSHIFNLNLILFAVKAHTRKDKCIFSFPNSQVNLLNSIYDNFHQ